MEIKLTMDTAKLEAALDRVADALEALAKVRPISIEAHYPASTGLDASAELAKMLRTLSV